MSPRPFVDERIDRVAAALDAPMLHERDSPALKDETYQEKENASAIQC
jgi:hypothetical protein